MVRRSSARLRALLATPQPVSSSHDTLTSRAPFTVPARLESLRETDCDGDEVHMSTQVLESPTRAGPKHLNFKAQEPLVSHQSEHQTPKDFEPPHGDHRTDVCDSAQPQANRLRQELSSQGFQFTFRREHSLELSPEAKKIMIEKRDEALRIRQQMIAAGEKVPSAEELQRRIARPKGRFSQAHLKEFEKMQSIATRLPTMKSAPPIPPTREQGDCRTTRPLKRSPSKAGLDSSVSTPSHPAKSQHGGSQIIAFANDQRPTTSIAQTSMRDQNKAAHVPTKRMKLTEHDDVSSHRPSTGDQPLSHPSTAKRSYRACTPQRPSVTTPTSASLARLKSLQSKRHGRISGPLSPTKSAPSKATKTQVDNRGKLKSSSTVVRGHNNQHANTGTELLACSPRKGIPYKQGAQIAHSSVVPPVGRAGLLYRSPSKPTVSINHEPRNTKEQMPLTPYLARSPTRLPITVEQTAEISIPRLGNLLCRSPVKSILRSPHRLYSDDPAKVAAGTHFATPPENGKVTRCVPAGRAPATAPIQKHVDFSSSTKARDAKANSATPPAALKFQVAAKPGSGMPGKISNQVSPDVSPRVAMLSPSPQKRRQTSGPQDFTFRAGDQNIIFGNANRPSLTPDKVTSTIRMVSKQQDAVIHGSAGSRKRKFDFPNITSDPQEDIAGTSDKENVAASSGEDDQDQHRPAKRARPGAAATTNSNVFAPVAQRDSTSTKRRAPSVKTIRGTAKTAVTRPSSISQARLAALSTPKKRR